MSSRMNIVILNPPAKSHRTPRSPRFSLHHFSRSLASILVDRKLNWCRIFTCLNDQGVMFGDDINRTNSMFCRRRRRCGSRRILHNTPRQGWYRWARRHLYLFDGFPSSAVESLHPGSSQIARWTNVGYDRSLRRQCQKMLLLRTQWCTCIHTWNTYRPSL